MAVLAAEVKLYRSATVSDAGANGGRMGIAEAVSAAAQNIFPDAGSSERAAGSVKYRKGFWKVENPNNEAFQNAYLYLDGITPGDDIVQMFAGTQTDTQADISSPTLYGTGTLNSSVLAGATEIDVLVEDWTEGAIFHDGDRIRISNGSTTEYATVSGAPSVAGNVITLTLSAGLANGFASVTTRVASGIDLGDIQSSFDSWVETAAGSGVYDEGTAGNVEVDAVGGIEQDWTLTFTGATTFNLSGNTLGAVGSGTIGSDFSPNNPNFSEPYFTILAAGWAGTWQAGDTVTFTTHPAAAPVWFKRIIPAGAASQSSNAITQKLVGETA